MEEQEIEKQKLQYAKIGQEKDVYQKLYLMLFNAITDALELLDRDRLLARARLTMAQQQAEEYYINYGGESDEDFLG